MIKCNGNRMARRIRRSSCRRRHANNEGEAQQVDHITSEEKLKSGSDPKQRLESPSALACERIRARHAAWPPQLRRVSRLFVVQKERQFFDYQ